MSRDAVTDAPLIAPIAGRWSPRAFADRPLEPGALSTLLEAARWAPSCFNEQPWRFITAERSQPEAFSALAGLLFEKNRQWASGAAALVVSVAKETFTRNDRPNAHAWHDVGLAVGQMIVQARAMDIYAHQMAGFDRARAPEALGFPEGYAPVAVIALGYLGAPDALPEDLAQREAAPRARRALDEIAFVGSWGGGK